MRSSDPLLADEGFVQRLAMAIGPDSASARALAELDERRAAGEAVVLLTDNGRLVVRADQGLAGMIRPLRVPAPLLS